MRSNGAALHFGLFIAGLAALAMAPPDLLMAQIVPPLASQTGTVTGVVRTAGGAPAAGIRVTAMRVEAVDDALRAMASLAQTDSMGRYRLENVPPGRYYITAGRVDLPTYYPGTLDMTKGSVISISSVALVSDIDFVIQDQSATLPNAPGGFGLRSGGAPGAPGLRSGGAQGALPVIDLLGGLNFTLGQTFQSQGGPGRNSGPGPTTPPAPLAPGLQGRGAANVPAVISPAGWWTNAALVSRLGLTDDQKKKVEATYQQYRQTLVQNKADLEKEEATLNRMLEAEPMEPVKTISAQIERVVQTRADMERTNSKMTLEIRQNLTRAQWVQLQTETVLQSGAGSYVITQPAPRQGGNAPALRSGGRGSPNPPAPAPPVNKWSSPGGWVTR